SIGTFVWPTALSLPKSTANRAGAEQLAERIAAQDVEQLLVARVPGFLPLRPGIPVPPGVTSASGLVVISVDPAEMGDEIAKRRARLAEWSEAARKKK